MKSLKLKFRLIIISVLSLSYILGLGILVPQTASAAFYDKKSDCEKAKGIWIEDGKRCWLIPSDGKTICKNAKGTWVDVPVEQAPYQVGLVVADAVGYCSIKSDNPDPEPNDCPSGGINAISGECAETIYCQKYKNNTNRKACLAGFAEGDTKACSDYKGDAKNACEDGAENSTSVKANKDKASETTSIGADYDSEDCTNGLSGKCKLVDLIVTITNVASGLAATVIVAMIIIGGIQYSMAGAEAAKVQAAKQKIVNALLALMLLIFGFSIIQWLIPGGLI